MFKAAPAPRQYSAASTACVRHHGEDRVYTDYMSGQRLSK